MNIIFFHTYKFNILPKIFDSKNSFDITRLYYYKWRILISNAIFHLPQCLFIRIDEEVEPMIIGEELIRSTMERLVRLIFGQGTIIVQLLIDRSKIHSAILHVGRIKIRTSSVNLIISSSYTRIILIRNMEYPLIGYLK